MITPHGGTLINRELKGKKRDEAEARANSLPKLTLSERELCDLEMIATGAMSPLEGFMTQAEFESCLNNKVLTNGLPWTIPVTKAITDQEKAGLKDVKEAALADSSGRLLAIFEIESIFPHDKQKHATLVYGTDDENHPGIKQIAQMGNWLVGGRISVFNRPKHDKFLQYRLDPAEMRELFKKKGWI